MDFFKVKERPIKGRIEVYPDFYVCRSQDLMVRGKAFYAIWDEEKNLWSTDEYDVQRLVDKELFEYRRNMHADGPVDLKLMSDFSSNCWQMYRRYINNVSDNSHQLDEKLTFADTPVKKEDYISKRLPYPLQECDTPAYEELISTLYDPEERAKLEWAIGAVVCGDAKHIQKFIVLYGEQGAGKSTILNIIQALFPGYYTTFEAKALTSLNNAFSTEVFRTNPLVGIQHDGDLSRIEDNTKLNSIVSHEEMVLNEKYKASYTARINCFLFMATNRPVKITDAKSGVIRRLIDVHPSGRKVPPERYDKLVEQINFELGGIAKHCLDIYKTMGKTYYNRYRPIEMMYQTDTFFNFVESCYEDFIHDNAVTLKCAYELYKKYCDDALVDFKLPMHKFREELKNYFEKFEDVARVDGKQVRSYYSGFLADKFSIAPPTSADKKDTPAPWLVFDSAESVFDKELKDAPAQYASTKETPMSPWEKVKSTLKDLDTTKLHYVQVPENHIVIDFDLKDENGEKSYERNLEAALKWPPTYAELSKSGKGIHLHYIYKGDPTRLCRLYDEDIEVKVFSGNSSLRRKLTKCNALLFASIASGLKLKGEKRVVNFDQIKDEKVLMALIKKNLQKKIVPATKPSIDFIYNDLEKAYKSGMKYDVTCMRPAIMAFANNSTHNASYCLSVVNKMHFKSDDEEKNTEQYTNDELCFFDCEVFPNLLLINYKFEGEGKKIVRMINPEPEEVAALFKFKLVGFNCRRYDNHILYARSIGFSNKEIFELSQRLISGSRNAGFGEAYNLSYTDIYDFSSKKQSLKKFEIELGLHHQELGYKWDEPVPEDKWGEVAAYCDNDVISTEATFYARKDDFTARKMLAEIAGMTVNDTTQALTAKIIFGDDKNPQSKFIYTDLSTDFPGYTFDAGKSQYRGEDPGEGGYVYAQPGMYGNVALLDIESMHPHSIIALNAFGEYTPRFKELLELRLAIKHKEFDKAKQMFNGAFEKYLNDESVCASLSYALKIAINIVYGLTSAKFDNKFRDSRNKDNIVAKRGALFMINLKHEVQSRGYTVAHIKTDSIKIPDATPEIIEFVKEYGRKYGYNFDHEATYDKMCLVNDAVYIAKVKEGKHAGEWTATGAQFAQPYVFKTLFSKEPVIFTDLCETKTVTSALYLAYDKEGEETQYQFVGKAGSFCPMKPECEYAGRLVREKDGKYNSATGAKDYLWLEAETVKNLGLEEQIDKRYYQAQVDEAVKSISQYGDFEWFVAPEPYADEFKDKTIDTTVPWFSEDGAGNDLPFYFGGDLIA